MDDQPLILVVNDDQEMCMLFTMMLERKNMRVLKAGTGCEALAVLGDQVPDLVFTDDMMPDMGGYDLCRRLRASGRFTHTPILLMTTMGMGYFDTIEETGFNAFILLPLGPRELLAFIERWLAWGRVQQGWHALPEAERGDYARALLRDADENDPARVAALDLLVETGLITDHAELVALRDTRVTVLQQCALEHLALFPLDVTRAPLRDLLHHAKPELRATAIKVLNTYPDPDLPSLLVELIPDENRPSVLIAALRALEPICDRYPVAFYVAILVRPHQSTSYREGYSDNSVDRLVARIFQRLPPAEVVDEVIARMVQAEDATLRRRAIHPLKQLGGALAFETVQQLAERDPDEEVRQWAERAIKAWEQ